MTLTLVAILERLQIFIPSLLFSGGAVHFESKGLANGLAVTALEHFPRLFVSSLSACLQSEDV